MNCIIWRHKLQEFNCHTSNRSTLYSSISAFQRKNPKKRIQMKSKILLCHQDIGSVGKAALIAHWISSASTVISRFGPQRLTFTYSQTAKNKVRFSQKYVNMLVSVLFKPPVRHYAIKHGKWCLSKEHSMSLH